jgi:hypothetical protein
MEETKYNEGLWKQFKDSKPTQQPRKVGLSMEDLKTIKLHIFGETVKHTEQILFNWEDLQQAIKHYRFIYKYNLA